MAHIDISRPHARGRAQAHREAEAVADSLRRRFGVQTAWDGDVLRVDGAGVRGAITATDDLVQVTAHLGLALRPLRRTLAREIERHLDAFAREANGLSSADA
ncbi:MAG: polyhydroxyalkanoic acid system family protein [Rubricoccaceae bacterium]|nr:polyhydroxyalkanoic acid system family protein [Rubricoccaceae bacterium]